MAGSVAGSDAWGGRAGVSLSRVEAHLAAASVSDIIADNTFIEVYCARRNGIVNKKILYTFLFLVDLTFLLS